MPDAALDPEADLSRAARALRRAFDRDARLTKRQVGALLGCTPRHAARVVDELRGVGVPVEEGWAGRAKEFFVPTAHQRRAVRVDALDEEALRALTVAADASRALLAHTPLGAPLQRAFATLLAAVGDDRVYSFDPEAERDHWTFQTAAAPHPGPLDTLRTLDRAITDAQSVRVDYVNGRGERSRDRVLDPLAMAPFPSGWQLAAYCHARRAVRNFNPSRIEAVAPVPEAYFAPPAGWDPDAHFGGRFGALEGDGRLRTVRLRVAPAVAEHFRTRDYYTTQRAEPDPDRPGGLLVTFQVPELEAMRAFVRSWGPNVVAVDPPELVRQLADDARRTAAAYAATPEATGRTT